MCIMLIVFACLCVCQQDYCKSNHQIALRLDVMIGPAGRKNLLIFVGDLVSHMDFRLLLHFPHHCRMGHLGRCRCLPYTVAFYDTRLNDQSWQRNESTMFWEWSDGHPDVYPPGNPDLNPRSLLDETTKVGGSGALGAGGGMQSLSALSLLIFTLNEWSLVAGSFSSQSSVDECIERIAESINYAHSRVEKVVTGYWSVPRTCLVLKTWEIFSQKGNV